MIMVRVLLDKKREPLIDYTKLTVTIGLGGRP